MAVVKEDMLYIDERIVLRDTISDLLFAIRLASEDQSNCEDGINRLDGISLSQVEAIRDLLESLADCKEGAIHLSELITAIKEDREEGGSL